MQIKRLILLALLFMIITKVFGQGAKTLLNRLEKELFPIDTSSIFLHEALADYTEYTYKVDSTIRIRKKQPNPDTSLLILKELLLLNDPLFVLSIQKIYDQHIEHFMSEWGEFYQKNIANRCTIARRQFDILTGFEELLLSLSLKQKGLNSEELFKYYKDKKFLDIKVIYSPYSRHKLLDKYIIFSEKYKTLNSNAWFAGQPGFSYFDPYLEITKPYFIAFFQECNIEEDRIESLIFQAVFMSINYYKKVKDVHFKDYILETYDKWRSRNSVHFAFSYASKHYFSDLTVFLAKNFYSDKEFRMGYDNTEWPIGMGARYGLLTLLLRNNKNIALIKKMLLEDALIQLEQHNAFPIECLSFFPDDDVVSFLIDLAKSKHKSMTIEEQRALKWSLIVLQNNSALSPRSKKRIKKILKKTKL